MTNLQETVKMDITQFENEKQFAKELRAWRMRLRENGRPVSQQRIANMTGIWRESITRIENGEIAPRLDTIFSIIHAFKTIESEQQKAS